MNNKILIGTSTFAAEDQTPLHRLIEEGYEVHENPYKRKLAKAELIELLASGVTGLIAGLETLDREVLEISSLKVISRCGSGLSNVDLEAAREMGITVCSTPLGPVTAVAELTVGCMLCLLRHVPRLDRDLHGRQWKKRMGRQLKDAIVAVIGLGNIGRYVSRLLRALGAKIISVDPRYSGKVEEIPVLFLEDALRQADIITIHASGEDCILSEREFDLMKKGVYILNAARGTLINEEALKRALDTGQVAGAWLDTFYDEPYKGDLCKYDQVILTPHIGSYTYECRQSMELEAVENLIQAMKEKP